MIKFFSDIRNTDTPLCGGKGASLGELTHAGFIVPNGFVLTIQADESNIAEWSAAVYQAFDRLGSGFVAVRSSATKEDGVDDSFAGQFDTYLFVTRDTLIQKITECHQSINSPRIKAYCESKKIPLTDIKIAVVVQVMIASEVAGVCFTVNPISFHGDQIMIDAGYGLGEAVVSGIITPDNYIVSKKLKNIRKSISVQTKQLVYATTGGICEVDIVDIAQEKQKLSDTHILELTTLAQRIEKHYGKPMDIERAFANDTLYILQARPITTLPNQYDTIMHLFGSEFAYKGTYTMGLHINDIWQSKESSQLIYDVFGEYRGVLPVFSIDHDKKKIMATFYLEKKTSQRFFDRISKSRVDNLTYMEKKFMQIYTIQSEIQKDFLDYSYDIDSFSHEEIITLYKRARQYYHKLAVYDHISWFIEDQNDVFVQDVFDKISKRNNKTNNHDVLHTLLKSHRSSSTLLSEIATLNSAVKVIDGVLIEDESSYLEKTYGYMPIGAAGTGWDNNHFQVLLQDLMKKGREYCIQQIASLEKSIGNALLDEKKHIYQEYRMTDREKQVFKDFEIIADMRNECGLTLGIITRYLEKIINYILSYLNISSFELDCCYEDEIIDALQGKTDIQTTIKNRLLCGFYHTVNFEERIEINNPQMMQSIGDFASGSDNTDTTIPSEQGKGLCAKTGVYEGIVRFVHDPSENWKVHPGDIMVAHTTLVDFLPAMKNAGAIITEHGGLTCHTAVVAREFGIPCIVGRTGIMSELIEGEKIRIDAANLSITLLE